MNLNQRLVAAIFFTSYGIRTAITCFAMDLLISVIGSGQLGAYFSIAAVISITSVCSFSFLSQWFSNMSRFIGLHCVIVGAALCCILLGQPELTAKITFLCMVGLGLMIYFSNWSIASIFINPFESRRIFPKLGVCAQFGMLCGSLFAMSSNYGFPKSLYIPIWLGVEVGILMIALFLKTKEKSMQTHVSHGEETQKVGLIKLVSHYRLIPKITVWIFLWGVLFTSIKSLTGKSFGESGINLTALYGGLDLSAAILSAVLLTIIYPKAVKVLHLGTMLFAASILLFVAGTTYLSMNGFTFALMAFLVFKLLEETFITMSISTKFGLYSSQHRDRLRLLSEILSRSAGASFVGVLFLLPSAALPWALAGILAFLVYFGFATRNSFNAEVLNFLDSKEDEERNNAIALFDRVNNEREYSRVISMLENSDDLALRINILNTFSNLKTPRPAPVALNLLIKDDNQPLQIAVLKYLDQVDFRQLDPFLNYKLTLNLKNICTSHYSNVLRSLAIRVLLKKSPLSQTVDFVVQALNDSDDRVIANAIDGLNYVNYPGVVDLLKPFLNHKVPRVRANTVIALWKYPECRFEVKKALGQMLENGDRGCLMSGIFAVGEVKEVSKIEFLKSLLDKKDKDIDRGVLIALLKLGCMDYYNNVVDMILGDDESQAINTCYLTLRIEPQILNEKIISEIYHKGPDFISVAISRYSRCGGFCREQVELLEGKGLELLRTGS